MKPALKLIPLTVAIALLASACSRDGYYYDRNEEYRSARMTEPLVLPESRQQSRYQDAMPVPRASSDFFAEDEFEAPRPRALAAARQDTQAAFVEDRQVGADHWLLVNAAPASVWPRLQGFVEQRGLAITALDPSRGRIETGQAVLSVRQGLRNETSEVRCQNPGTIGATAPHEPCLTALSSYLASEGDQAQSVSLAAQNLSRDDRVRLENQAGNWQLLLSLGFERAWPELRYQLENFEGEGLRLVDQNRSSGEFLVEYAPGEAGDDGFFGLFGTDAASQAYRLLVDEPSQGMTRVRVAPAGDAPAEGSAARELLDTLASTLR
ncbi:MAG: outer membrane protein assembly factor BamC [Halomonas sp.]|nr:outer membrane protein assembly factor BamC [Halomonas sp.]